MKQENKQTFMQDRYVHASSYAHIHSRGNNDVALGVAQSEFVVRQGSLGRVIVSRGTY